jgi:lactate permease
MLSPAYQQLLDPLGNRFLSTAFAALPVVVLFWLLVPRRWLAPKAAAAGAVAAILVARFVYRMPLGMACMAFLDGAGFGLLPVGWTIFSAMLLYNITVVTGQFEVIRRSVAGLSGDARVQAILIGFAFGAFLEGAAGGGTPVAICGAIMVGLGFPPFQSAVLCLIANTSPVAYGGLGTPLITLNGVTGLHTPTLSVMAGHQLPFLSCLVPLWMVKCMCSWRQTLEVLPALFVAGGSFAFFQFTFATMHVFVPGVELWPMTDIGGGIFSLVVTAIFLKFWKPKNEWHFDQPDSASGGRQPPVEGEQPPPRGADAPRSPDAHAAEAAALVGSDPPANPAAVQKPLTIGSVSLAWAPYALMSVFLLLTGLVRQMEGHGPVLWGSLQTNYMVPVPALHNESHRDPRLHPIRGEQAAVLPLAASQPLQGAIATAIAQRAAPKPEGALFNFAWLTAPGTAVMISALVSMLMLRMDAGQIKTVFGRTVYQMKIPIPTIACMLGLSYVTRYAGMDATLGVAFAGTGLLYPFFAAFLGWLGVFLTGTDAGSNALFGSLQQITASEVYKSGAFTHITETQAQVLLHRQQHRRRHGQDDRRPEHLRGHRGHAPARPRSRYLQGRRLAQHRPRRPGGADRPAASLCVSVDPHGPDTALALSRTPQRAFPTGEKNRVVL